MKLYISPYTLEFFERCENGRKVIAELARAGHEVVPYDKVPYEAVK